MTDKDAKEVAANVKEIVRGLKLIKKLSEAKTDTQYRRAVAEVKAFSHR